MNTYFYPETIRSVITAFGNLFNDIQVKKYDKDGNALKTMSVPIRFGPVDKIYDSRTQDDSGKFYVKLPRLAYKLENITYDPERQTSVNTVRQWYSESLGLNSYDEFFSDPVPTPVNYNFVLHIRSENIGNWAQIIEQIFPYFRPSLYLRLKEFSFLNVERDLKVSFEGDVSPNMPDEVESESIRELRSELRFTVQGMMYYPVSSTKIIKSIESRYFVDTVSSAAPTSANAFQVEAYNTSGFFATSAGDQPDNIPTSGYDFSGFSNDQNMWYFTSAND